MKLIRVAVCSVAVAVLCGCASRMADLRDCGRLSVGVGLGLSADVKVGDLTHPSLGLMTVTHRVGLENREIVGYWKEGECAFPLIEVPNKLGEDCGFFTSYGRDLFAEGHDGARDQCHVVGFWLPFERYKVGSCELKQSAFNSTTDLQAGLTLGVVSARVGVNPLEIVDFLLGFVGLDIAGDDEREPVETARLVRARGTR
jgi:hypothetical protein